MKISPYSKLIIDEAKKKGIKIFPVGSGGKLFLLRRKGKHTFIYQSLTELISDPSYKIAANKFLTDRFLKKNGFPVPNFSLIKTEEQAWKFLQKNKKVVIKPLSANQGKGITIAIKYREELLPAMEKALAATNHNKLESAYKNAILIEKAVPGDDHRILVIDYRYIYAIKRIPAYVIGDGQHNIKQLIDLWNIRKVKHKKPVIIDALLRHVLQRQNLTLRDRPEKGQKIFVRRTANLATGGETIDITDEVHPKIKDMAIKAAKLLRMPIAGFDFMARDHRLAKGFFIEVNPIPGLMMHHYPHHGKSRNPAKQIVDLLIRKKII